jgi:preprotein translocase subunit YajC
MMNSLIHALVLQPQQQQEQPENFAQQNPMLMALLFVVPLIFLYTIMVGGPEKRRKKEKEKLVNNMGKGDGVVTIGGLHGRVVKTNEERKTVVINIAKDVDVEYSLQAIATVTPKGEKKAEES